MRIDRGALSFGPHGSGSQSTRGHPMGQLPPSFCRHIFPIFHKCSFHAPQIYIPHITYGPHGCRAVRASHHTIVPTMHHRAITRQFLSPYIPLPLNNLLTLALGTAFNYLKKTREDCFCYGANIQTGLWFSRQDNFWAR